MLDVAMIKKTVFLLLLSMVLVVVPFGCKKKRQPAEQRVAGESPAAVSSAIETQNSGSEPKKVVETPEQGKMTLAEIAEIARTWEPVLTNYYGKDAPDFTVQSIDGKSHKLSDYKGIDVMLIFWATWCGPCKMEVPDLIALRNVVGKDKLGMLAISNEEQRKVSNFAKSYKLNYTIALDRGQMPIPYSLVQGIPSSFFVDKNGKIKFATSGMLSLGEIKAIINADE